MNKKSSVIISIFTILLFSIAVIANAINITVPQSTSFGDILRGNANGTYTPVATSTLGITAGSAFSWSVFPNYNATSTTLGFLNGFLSTASSTQIGDLRVLSGNLGIGSSTPYASLSVTNTGTNPSFIVEDSASPDTSPFVIDASGNVGIGTNAPVATLQVHNFGTGSSDHAYQYFTTGDTGATSGDGLTVGYAANNTAQINNRESTDLEIRSGADVVLQPSTGNVGIGTMSPGASLHVLNGNAIIGTHTYGSTVNWEDSTEPQLFVNDGGSEGIIALGRDDSITLAALWIADDDLDFVISEHGSGGGGNNTKLFYIDSSTKNVGIGADTTPDYKLDVQGTFRADSVASFGDVIQVDGAGDSYFTGNVGIGETAPGSKLSVSGGGSFGASYDTTAAPSNGLIIQGNVGIGTTSPASALHVNGTLTLGVDLVSDSILNAPDRGLYLNADTNGNQLSGTAFQFGTNRTGKTGGVDLVTIQHSGNVGIGTTTPWAKLSILGNSATAPVFALATSTNKTVFSIDSDGIEDVRYGIHCQIGQFQTVAAQSIPTGSTYTKITSLASTTSATNTRYCTADTANSKIVVTRAGIYEVTGSINFSGSVNSTFRGALFIGGVEQNLIHFARKLSANDVGSVSFTGQFVATSSSNVDLRVRHDSGGAVNFSPMYMNLNVQYLGK